MPLLAENLGLKKAYAWLRLFMGLGTLFSVCLWYPHRATTNEATIRIVMGVIFGATLVAGGVVSVKELPRKSKAANL